MPGRANARPHRRRPRAGRARSTGASEILRARQAGFRRSDVRAGDSGRSREALRRARGRREPAAGNHHWSARATPPSTAGTATALISRLDRAARGCCSSAASGAARGSSARASTRASSARDHRSQCGPARPPARDASGDHPHPDQTERAPERRVEEIEPADARAVDGDGTTRQQAAVRNEPVAVVGELEVPVREQRAGGGQDERDEKSDADEHGQAERFGRHPVGRLAEQPLVRARRGGRRRSWRSPRVRRVERGCSDRWSALPRPAVAASPGRGRRREPARRPRRPRRLSPRAAPREDAPPPARRPRPESARRPTFLRRPPRPRPAPGRAPGGATEPAGRPRGCDRAARPASCAEGRRARSPVARLRSGR